VVAYLGHDDLWLPQHLELLVQAIDGGAAAAHASVLQVHPHHAPSVTPADGWAYSRGNWIPPTSIAIARTVLQEAGGWRMPRETGYLDPDADLLARVNDIAGPPVWIRRLTCVKLPAASRHDVYRTRPHAEQEHWLREIRESPDPEAAMLATVGTPYALAQDPPSVPFHIRAWRSLRYRSRRALGLRVRSSTRIRRTRRFKGL
jgi:hypothetical protein